MEFSFGEEEDILEDIEYGYIFIDEVNVSFKVFFFRILNEGVDEVDENGDVEFGECSDSDCFFLDL